MVIKPRRRDDLLSQMGNYPKLESKDGRVVRQGARGGIAPQVLVVQTPFGYRRAVEMLRPETDGSYAAILYVHWYEPGRLIHQIAIHMLHMTERPG
jgi:hypothetical protein